MIGPDAAEMGSWLADWSETKTSATDDALRRPVRSTRCPQHRVRRDDVLPVATTNSKKLEEPNVCRNLRF